jgi:hypothetical protein
MDTFDVAEVKMRVIYPTGRFIATQPYRSKVYPKGSFAPIEFFMQYGKVILMKVSFHSLKSCSVIVSDLENSSIGPGAGCDDVPRSIYSPEEFNKQHLAFQNKDSLPGYDILTVGGKSYFYSCYYAEGGQVFSSQALTFRDDIRVTLQMASNYPDNCDKIYEECKNLLSKIEFIPYKPKKK